MWIVIPLLIAVHSTVFFPLREDEDACEVVLTSLICQYSIHGLLMCCISYLNVMTDFGLLRDRARVCERACTLIKEGYLISISCAEERLYFMYCMYK